MAVNPELQKFGKEGKAAFESGQYASAVEAFQKAVEGYANSGDVLNAAEMKNNLSVALLKAGKAQAALDAAQGTDEIFAQSGDLKRQGMALGNQAAALEALKQFDEALDSYERSAELFAQVGEGDLKALVLKSAAAIKLKRGKVTDSAFKMIGSLEAKDKPSIFERILRTLLRFIQR